MRSIWLVATVVAISAIGSSLIFLKRHTPTKIISQEEPFTQQQEREIPRETVYVVKEGDSLWSIARKFGVSLRAIAELNNISIDKILQIGDRLRIPAELPHSSSSRKAEEQVKQIPTGGQVYQVRRGDSLWTISRKFEIKVEDIARVNNISLDKPLQIGDKLLIPGSGNRQVAQPQTPHKGANRLKVVREGVLVRKGPGTVYPPLAKLSKGREIISLGQQGDWQKVSLSEGKIGWIRRDMLGFTLAKKSSASSSKNNSSSRSSSPKGGSGSTSVVKTALSYQGTRYAYGGLSSRGFDCSGFVKYIYQKHGINLPHNSKAQFEYGKPVSENELQPGDLVFFRTRRSRGINHVGIYIGNGKFVHASSARGRVKIDSLNEGYYKDRYMGARRVKF